MPTLVTYSEVSLCNMALDRIGAQSQINSLDNTIDSSVNAKACTRWYPQSRDAVLTDFPWTWAQGSAPLGQINTLYPASPEFQFSYQYPVGPPAPLIIYAVVPTCTPQSQTTPPQTTGLGATIPWMDYWWRRAEGKPCPWPFRVNSGPTGRLVMTDLPNATALFVQQITDPTQYAADFADLLIARLSVELAFSIAISEERREAAKKQYKQVLQKTRARLMNEAQSDIPLVRPNSVFTRARLPGA